MKLTYLLLLSAIIGFAAAQNAAEASKCRSNNATGNCLTCPTDGSTTGGPRQLAANTCTTVRTTVLTSANGAANVLFYGSATSEAPNQDNAWVTAFYPGVATLFTCKDGFAAVQ